MSTFDLETPGDSGFSLPAGIPLPEDDEFVSAAGWNTNWTVLEDQYRGRLDYNNIAGAAKIQHDQVRKGAFVRPFAVGGTANLDYPRFLYVHVNQDDWSSDHPTYIRENNIATHPIPGAAVTFDVPWDGARVFLRWNLFWLTETLAPDYRVQSHLVLKIDGTPIRNHVRSCGPSTAASPIDAFEYRNLEGYKANRAWTGHHVLSLAKGQHTASIEHVADRTIPMTRVWVRGMRGFVINQGNAAPPAPPSGGGG